MELIAANGQMGISCSGRNGVVGYRSRSNPALLFSLSRNPFFGLVLNVSSLSKTRCLDVKMPNCGAVSALQIEEKEANPVAERLLKKELSFSPTFGDYVKVMESVRVERGKDGDGLTPRTRSGRDSGTDEGRSEGNGKLGWLRVGIQKGGDIDKERKLGVTGKDKEARDSRRLENHRKTNNGETHGSGWDAVQGLLDKGRVGRGGGRRSGKVGNKEGSTDLPSEKGQRSNATRENAINPDLEKRNVGYWGNDSNNQKNLSQVERFARTNEKLGVRGSRNASKVGRDRYPFEVPVKQHKIVLDERHGKTINETKSDWKLNEHQSRSTSSEMDKISKRQRRETKIERSNAIARVDSPNGGMDGKRLIDDRDTFKMVTANGVRNVNAIYSKSDSELGSTHRTKRSLYQSSNEIRRHGKSEEHSELHEYASETENFVSRTVVVGGGLQKNIARMNTGRDIYDIDLEDRAAFKTFEVFTDVRNRPRVLRMEMEERIRNLATWLNATDVNMPEWRFSKMMHNAKIKFTDHSILRVVQILGEFGNWRRVLQVVEWLQSRERFKSYKSKYIYTAVLDVLGKAKRPVEALNIFHSMRQEKSSYPDLAAYHCIAVTLGQAGLMKELFDVIDCMRTFPKKKFNLGLDQKWNPRLEPDLIVYNAVLNACIQQKQWEGAFWVLQQLKQQYIKPSSTTYGLVMEVMLACGKYNLVHEFFRKVEKTSVPSTLSYRVLVNTLWREEKIDEAVLAVQDMERRGIVGSASLYYDLARCLCSAGRCQEALMQIDKICKVAKKPLVVTYTGLIQACLDSGNIKGGAYIFNEMHKFCSPNIVTCNIMLKSYLENGMYDDAVDLFQKILDGSNVINSSADFRGKIVPDKFTFNAMMEASAAAKNWDGFEHVYMKMLHHGYHFDKKRHLRMIMDAARAGKGIVVDRTWEYLVRSGRDPPIPIIKERFRMKLEDDDHTAAISCLCIQQCKEPHAFSTEAWLNLLKFNSDNVRADTIARLVDEIKDLLAEGDSPQPIFQNLLDACLRFLDPFGIVVSEVPGDQIFSSVINSSNQ